LIACGGIYCQLENYYQIRALRRKKEIDRNREDMKLLAGKFRFKVNLQPESYYRSWLLMPDLQVTVQSRMLAAISFLVSLSDIHY